MSEGFNKFKKKIFQELIIKSILIGVSFGLLAFAITFIPCKVTGNKLNPYIYILIGLGVSLLVGGILFLILKPNKVKLAKRMDKELNLNQKVQTMVEFEGENNIMLQIQREDTNDKLKSISIKNLKMKFNFIFIIIPILAIAACITSIAIPAKAEETPPIVDEDYTVNVYEIQRIKDLIKYIQSSKMNDELKSKDINELNNLIDLLKLAEKDSQMKETVNSCINAIELNLDLINSNNEVYQVLSSNSNSEIRNLALQINKLDYEKINNCLDSLRLQIKSVDGTVEAQITAATELQKDLSDALRNSNLDTTDALYISLMGLVNSLTEVISSATPYETATVVFDITKPAILEAIKNQVINNDVTLYVINELKDIFGLNENNDNKNPNDQAGEGSSGTGENTDKNNDPTGGGGLGSGDTVYGGEGYIYDPEEGLVEYRTLINEYNSIIFSKFDEELISDELKDFFDKYFNNLYNGIEDKEGEE